MHCVLGRNSVLELLSWSLIYFLTKTKLRTCTQSVHIAYCIFFIYFLNEILNFLLIFSLHTIPARVISEAGCNVSFTPVSLGP